MRIINKRTLDAFKVKHAIAEPNLVAWEQIVSQAEWTCWTDVRNHLGRRVDRVPLAGGVAFVFDLHGNDFRLIAGVVYAGKNAKGLPYQGEIYLKEFLTHAEYDEEDWKERFTA